MTSLEYLVESQRREVDFLARVLVGLLRATGGAIVVGRPAVDTADAALLAVEHGDDAYTLRLRPAPAEEDPT